MLGRNQLILRELRANGRLSVDELAKKCDCSAVTVRRALQDLQNEGLVVRTPGGALAVDHIGVEVAFPERLTINSHQKKRIARKAADLIEDNSVIFMDNGSSVYLLADYIGDKKNLTIVTFFLPLVNKLAIREDWKIIIPGGQLRQKRSDLTGPLTEEFIRKIYADKLFFGADGLDVLSGISTVDQESARLTQVLAECASQRILLADSSKLAKRATFASIGWDKVDAWIVDDGLDEESVEMIKRYDVELMIV